MAEFFFDESERRVGAVLTAQEWAMIAPILNTPDGQRMVQSLFASLMERFGEERRERDLAQVREFLNRASQAQLSRLLDIIREG